MLRQGCDSADAQLLRAALDGVDEAVCVIDGAGALVLMSQAAEALTGYRQTELHAASLPLVPPICAEGEVAA